MKKSALGIPSRRDVVRSIGVAGLGAAVSVPIARRAFAQTKKAVNISFWTFDNPQQRPWVHKRVKIFMEQNPHVKVDGAELRFQFKGKSGKTWRLQIKDRRIAKIVKACQDLPGQELFQYLVENGERMDVTSIDEVERVVSAIVTERGVFRPPYRF